MKKREEIRWAPFESVFSTKEIIKEIIEKKEKQPKPILSEDEFLDLEKKILEAIHTQEKVKITYYYNGRIYHKIGIISTILKNSFQILFQDKTSLYFEQILEIKN